MTYKDQLSSNFWKDKRAAILQRDKNICQQCRNAKIIKNGTIGLITKTTVYDIHAKNHVYVDLQSETFKYDNPLSSICFFSKEEKVILGVIGKTFAVNNLVNFKLNFDDESEENENAFSEFFFQYYNGRLVLDFIGGADLPSFEWKYVYNFHIHHTYYKSNFLAWEYPEKSLLTLCWSCHEELHKNSRVPEYDAKGNLIGTKKVCKRCFGAGWFPQFSHVENGICFECNGARFI